MKANEQKKTLKNEIKPEKKHNIHDGHRDRMRERFSKTGFEGMQEHEILEMLLYYSVPRRDTNPIAHNLIDRFGSLAGVLEAKEEQLLLVDGITQNSATLIKMILPMFHHTQKRFRFLLLLKIQVQKMQIWRTEQSSSKKMAF